MLKGGENKINVELNKEKKFKINVIAYNYETNSPLETVQIKVTNYIYLL